MLVAPPPGPSGNAEDAKDRRARRAERKAARAQVRDQQRRKERNRRIKRRQCVKSIMREQGRLGEWERLQAARARRRRHAHGEFSSDDEIDDALVGDWSPPASPSQASSSSASVPAPEEFSPPPALPDPMEARRQRNKRIEREQRAAKAAREKERDTLALIREQEWLNTVEWQAKTRQAQELIAADVVASAGEQDDPVAKQSSATLGCVMRRLPAFDPERRSPVLLGLDARPRLVGFEPFSVGRLPRQPGDREALVFGKFAVVAAGAGEHPRPEQIAHPAAWGTVLSQRLVRSSALVSPVFFGRQLDPRRRRINMGKAVRLAGDKVSAVAKLAMRLTTNEDDVLKKPVLYFKDFVMLPSRDQECPVCVVHEPGCPACWSWPDDKLEVSDDEDSDVAGEESAGDRAATAATAATAGTAGTFDTRAGTAATSMSAGSSRAAVNQISRWGQHLSGPILSAEDEARIQAEEDLSRELSVDQLASEEAALRDVERDLAVASTSEQDDDAMRAMRDRLLEQMRQRALARLAREEAWHTDLRRRQQVVEYRAAFESFQNVLVKSLPCGRVIQFKVELGDTIRQLYDQFRANSVSGCEPSSHLFLLMPTEKGTFVLDNSWEAPTDLTNGSQMNQLRLRDYSVRRNPLCPLVLFHVPRVHGEMAVRNVGNFLGHNIDLHCPGMADLVSEMHRLPATLPGADRVQNVLQKFLHNEKRQFEACRERDRIQLKEKLLEQVQRIFNVRMAATLSARRHEANEPKVRLQRAVRKVMRQNRRAKQRAEAEANRVGLKRRSVIKRHGLDEPRPAAEHRATLAVPRLSVASSASSEAAVETPVTRSQLRKAHEARRRTALAKPRERRSVVGRGSVVMLPGV